MYSSYSLMTFHVSCICLTPMPKSFDIFKIKFWHILTNIITLFSPNSVFISHFY